LISGAFLGHRFTMGPVSTHLKNRVHAIPAADPSVVDENLWPKAGQPVVGTISKRTSTAES
jgi:hypothetical protein